ncbi:resolvase [Geodermatophilus sp. Leaf369]|uniref:recombinase family protein n=1 Tax=Geodermatophilus sp. Leaf369 TaxID=1736354 RepID=UPI0006F518A4|nr:recombinase family protein [Geodermatophilus sp. Leaf369]KQS57827.1 resolvase [Geodermatophilus sp. Leaf369]
MATLGYLRVSTDRQSLDQQRDALEAAGVEKFFEDKMSGKVDDRPGLLAMLDYARDGDTVVVVALDRLGRSLGSMIQTIDQMQAAGITLKSLRENVDFSTITGTLIAQIFSALAEYERKLTNERAAAARTAAAARGQHTGRPRALTPEQVKTAQLMRNSGVTISEISKAVGASRATIYRVLDTTKTPA